METIITIIIIYILYKILFGKNTNTGNHYNTSYTNNETKTTTHKTSQSVLKPPTVNRSKSTIKAPSYNEKKNKIYVSRKPDWKRFQNIVIKNNIRVLYHFTDKRNIQSIKKYGGLYSWEYCERNEIIVPYSASTKLSKSLDRRKGLKDYVRLSFNPNQPMMYVVAKERNIDPMVLEISTEVIYWVDTQFSNINATDNYAEVGPSLQHFQNINFQIALGNNWTNQEENKKYIKRKF